MLARPCEEMPLREEYLCTTYTLMRMVESALRTVRTLDGTEIHVWLVRLVKADPLIEEFALLLSPDELDRANRMAEHVRCSFVAVRGILRTLLGRYQATNPRSLSIKVGSKGKPYLDGMPLSFNVSHSGTIAVCAFTTNCRIGVDCEEHRAIANTSDIASRFFHNEEAAELASLPPMEREAAFFRCWTRKEAFVKALGTGLSTPLKSFRVTFVPDEPAQIILLDKEITTSSPWRLYDLGDAIDTLLPSTRYSASIAYEGLPREVHVFSVVDASSVLTLLP